MRSVRTSGAICAAVALSISVGCSSGKQMATTDREPVTDLGVGATIIMPGQSIPMSAMGGPGTGNLSSIGGASQQIDQKQATNQSGQLDTLKDAAKQATTDNSGQTPMWQRALAAPLAVAAYPFMKLGEAMEGGSEKSSSRTGGSGGSSAGSGSAPGAAEAGQAPQATASTLPPATASALPPARPPSNDPAVRAETARLGALERELAMQSPGPAPQGTSLPLERGTQAAPGQPLPWQQPQAAAPAPVVASAPPAGRRLTIAEELAALQSTIAPRPRAEDTARAASNASQRAAGSAPTGAAGSAPARAAMPTSTGLADRVRDRDGNGRPDLWSYHDESGHPTRELLDEDGDGSPDRTVWFEPETGSEARVEEDTNLDGRIDSWVEFSGGKVARQRRDRDFDGQLDTWSFYDGGELARQEEDTSGDGFRNRVAFYADGRLVRERQDRNGDGRVDMLTVYDDSERPLRRDEDTDGDGRIDQRSIYEGGKLVRRELVEAVINDSEEELNDTEWSSGPNEG